MKKKKVDNFVKVEVVENMHGGRGRGEQGRAGAIQAPIIK